MNGKLSPLALVALSLVLLCPVSVSATTTEVTQAQGRGANATWPDGTFVMVYAGNKEVPILGWRIFIVGAGPSIGFIMKELTPSEFKWSMAHASVSTEIDGYTLVVEWKTVPPTNIRDHTNDFGPIHLIHNGAGRDASATLMIIDSLGNIELTLEEGTGVVSEGVRVEITMP